MTTLQHDHTYGSALLGLQRAQKPGAGVSLYLRYVNRPIGRRLAAASAAAGLSPNQVTALSSACSLVGFAIIAGARPTVGTTLLAFVALFLAYALDSADGQLARLTGRGSAAGEWLDHVVDMGRTVLFHLILAVALFRFADVEAGWLLVPLCFAVVTSTRFFALMLTPQLSKADPTASLPAEQGGNLTGSLIQLPADTGILNLVVLLLPWPPLFLAAYGLALLANTVLAVATFIRKFRSLSTSDRPVQETS